MGAQDDSVDVKFGASTEGIETGAARAASSVTKSVGQMIGQLNLLGSAATSMARVFGTAFGVIASGALFKAGIQEAASMAKEVGMLGRRFDLTAKDATALSIALDDSRLSAEELTHSTDTLMRQVKNNEEALNKMGVKTRDASKNFLDQKTLVFTALDALREYKSGTDQLMAAQAIFGRGMDENMLKKLFDLQDNFKKTTVEADRFGRMVGVENLKAAKEYKEANKDLDDGMQAIRLTVGQSLMPIWTAFLRMLGDAVESVLPAVTVTMKILATVLEHLSTLAYGLFQVFKSLIQTIGQFIGGVVAAISALTSGGGWTEAKEAWNAMTDDMASTWNENAKNIEDRTAKMQENLKNLWEGPAASADQKIPSKGDRSGSKGFVDPNQADKAASEMLAKFKRDLEEMKRAEGDYKEFSKQKEVEFWAEKRDLFARGSKQWQEANILYLQARRAAAAESVDIVKSELDMQGIAAQNDAGRKLQIAQTWLAVMSSLYGEDSKQYREALKAKLQAEIEFDNQRKQIANIQAKSILDARLAGLDLDAEILQSRLQLGAIEREQAYQMQLDINRQRYELQLEDNARRFDLAEGDVVAQAQINAERYNLEVQYQNSVKKLQQSYQNETITLWQQNIDGILSSYGQVLQGMLTRTMTWRQAMQNILGSVLQMFIKMGLDKAKAWITSEFLMNAATNAGNTQRVSSDASAAAASVSIKTSEAAAKITESAGVAAAGAAESQASIPYVGPVLAAAAAAAMLAMVMGFIGGGKSGGGGTPTYQGSYSVPSAAGGWWDVPKDTFAKIHEQEMVMPKELASPIRDAVESGNFGQGGGNTAVIYAMDGDSVRQFFSRHGDVVFDTMKSKFRDNRR